MIVVFLITLYCAGGAAFFYFFDRSEMKKEVPYGDVPALASLGTIRQVMLGVSMAIGTGLMIVLAVQLILEFVVHAFTLRRAIFRLNRVLKAVGYNKRIRPFSTREPVRKANRRTL